MLRLGYSQVDITPDLCGIVDTGWLLYFPT